jgi:DNA-binding SARP family transcriptional activator/predicted ATPase
MPSSVSVLRIRLLGPLEILVGERPVVVDTRKALAIVALVAAERRPFARDELAAIFWPDADDEAARGALRRTLSALRTAVGERGLRIDRTRVAVDPEAAWVDLAEVERLAASSDPADLEAAAGLARGPFLAGFSLRDSPAFDDWHAARASRVEQTVGELLERLSGVRLAAGQLAGAVDASRRRVELDPLDESGQRRLIEVLGRTGDRAGAIGQYRGLVALFDRELGVPPLRETTALYDAIREGTFEPTAGVLSLGSAEVPVEVDGPAKEVSTRVPSDARPEEGGAWPLVGRDVELEAVLGAWRAIGPDGRLAIVEGEAGIGKTRLAEAVAATVRGGGGTVLASRGYEGESAIAYGPIAELLRAGMGLPGGIERLAELGEGVRLEIGRLIDLPPSLRVANSSVPDPASARVRLVEAIAVGLSALAGGAMPGLIWIDDLHLVDAPTREVVAYLARRLASRRILVLLAWRREDLAPDAMAISDDLRRSHDVTVVSLGRLGRAAVAEIVHAARPGGVGNQATDDLVAALLEESEGLPLHLVEALATGEVGADGRRGVEAILRDRIASVGETTGQILSAAAVIGRSFDFATVRAASGRSEEETIDALEELARRGIVRELPGSADAIRYDFRHGRLRETAYEITSLARRRLLHRRVADALRVDVSGAARDQVGRFALIASHEREGGRPQAAVAAYLEAADRAESVFANSEAIDDLEAALALDPSAGPRIHERIGHLHARLGDYPAAITALETAAALAATDDLPAIEVALGRVHRRRGDLAAAASHLDWALASLGAAPGDGATAVGGAAAAGGGAAVAAARPGDALRAQAQIERSLIALRRGDLEAADAAARDACEAAARASDRHLAGVGERLVGLVAQARGDVPAARSALERSLLLAVDDPDPTASIAASTALALTLAAAGSVDEAIETAEGAVEACRRIGDRHLEAAVENHLADMCHEAGRTDESMVHLKRAVALFAEIGEGGSEPEPGIWALAAW